jgi:hypothetical protein
LRSSVACLQARVRGGVRGARACVRHQRRQQLLGIVVSRGDVEEKSS